nr:unnamed protein product [Callosobruchus analis]
MTLRQPGGAVALRVADKRRSQARATRAGEGLPPTAPPAGAERRRAVRSWAGYGALTDTRPLVERDPVNPRRDNSEKASLLARPHSLAIGGSSTLAPPSRGVMPGIRQLLGAPRGGANNGAGRREDAAARSPLVKRRVGGEQTPVVKPASIRPAASLASLRRCDTVVALTGYLRSSSSSSSIEPLQPRNRLRPISPGSHSRLCSRCSSLLTLASASRYSLSSTTGGFVPVATPPVAEATPAEEEAVLCKLCLGDVPPTGTLRIGECGCEFCKECMKSYVEFEIAEGAYDISCPDAQCPSQGVLHEEEIKRLAGTNLLEKHKKYRLNREVDLDSTRTWCPRAGCETVCRLCPTQRCSPQSVFCPTCSTDFCSNCKQEWHEGISCDQLESQRQKEGKPEDVGIPFDSDLIKCCPMCNVPIEKDEGCAQMMCKRCKHVFCWYCLASLDDDFLLRHYDRGPCKNKLGHSRASVLWHRTQVVGIFASFGILLLVASPLLLLAAPCIACSRCRLCNADAASSRLGEDDGEEAGRRDSVSGTRRRSQEEAAPGADR